MADATRRKQTGEPGPPRAARRRFGSLVENGKELVVTLVEVVVFFLIFMGILLLSFPRGTGLPALYGAWVDRSPRSAELSLLNNDASGQIAVLTKVTRRVKDRPADAVAWKDAWPGMELMDRHAVQTLARSGAVIAFDDASTLELGENSLVVVKRPERRRRTRASLVVLGGRVRGRIDPAVPGARPLDILTAGATTQIRTNGEMAAEYSVTVNDDNTATLAVYAGTAEVTSAGQTAWVEPNQALTLRPEQPPGRVEAIPAAPQPQEPAQGTTLTWGRVQPQLRFVWPEVPNADTYRLVVARDAAFEVVIYDAVVDAVEAFYGNLEQGRYYWRVYALNGRAESPASPTRSFDVFRDVEPPMLQVVLPDEVVQADSLVVRGATLPDVELLIGTERVAVAADGSFEYALALRRGPNLIVIEAVDAAGNVAYHSQYVNAKY